MTDKRINLIFDCDGTLVDSYPAIVDRFCRVFKSHGVDYDPEIIRRRALLSTVDATVTALAHDNGLDPALLKSEFSLFDENQELIELYPGVSELLSDSRFRCFVYTHRGPGCRDIFSRLGIDCFFEEVVDGGYHFNRKPDPMGVNYLVEKYGLDRSLTYYVGDRVIDLECGKNAGAGTIFFQSSGLDMDTSKADYIVSRLMEIPGLFFK